jgi:dimeric dUTPase (all-alpha-NTP-PPase superfamily)
MVSTYLTYNLVNRDMKGQLERIGKTPEVSRDEQYYKDNIGTVKTADEFVKNYRLFSFAMKAYGLEDMTYASAFMKKVLDSDLNDTNSFANKLTDDRYRKFAQAFQFTAETTVIQTTSQEDDVVSHYKQSVQDESDAVDTANAAFKTGIAKVKSVDDLLGNEQIRTYALKAFGVDSPYWSKDFLTKVLTSDVTDPASYVNTLTIADKSNYKAMAAAFNFNAAGTLDSGDSAQTAAQTTSTVESYTFSVTDRLTAAGANLNKTYFESKIATITNVDDLVNDSRMFDYVKTAYGLDKLSLKSEMKNILTSDLTDPNNYATKMGGTAYETLTKAFNFKTDGTLNAATAQTTVQTTTTSSLYMQHYDDADATADDGLYTYYKSNISSMKSLSDIEGTGKVYNFVLAAFGFDSTTMSKKQFEQTLESDLTDPTSFANKQKDKRYTDMASAFNFDSKGNLTAPLLAQSQQNLQQIASEYIIRKTRFGHDDQKTQATADATAYTTGMQDVKTVSDFLSNRKLVDFVLTSKGIDPKDVKDDFMKQLFASDLDDPKSFANQQTDHRFVEIVGAFNFNAKGEIASRDTGIQSVASQRETEYMYLQQTLEQQTGDDSQGARLALYFERKLPTINTAYDILGDTALLEVFRTTYELPAEMSTMNIDKQKTLVDKYLKLEDLQDPDKLKQFLSRFTAMYDLANDTTQDPVLSLFSDSTSTGVSADTLLAVAQLKN